MLFLILKNSFQDKALFCSENLFFGLGIEGAAMPATAGHGPRRLKPRKARPGAESDGKAPVKTLS